jgi:hypothetical protein
MSMMGMQWVRKYHWSMRDLFYPSYAGTLTRTKLIATFVSAFLPPEQFALANCCLCFW